MMMIIIIINENGGRYLFRGDPIMDVLEAIRTRRSIARFKPECPPRTVVEGLLAAATWAPNHHRVEPWRFFILAGEARRQFGDVVATVIAEQHALRTAAPDPTIAERTMAKVLRAPVLIVATVEPPRMPQVIEMENIQAVAAAIQNLLLAAHATGLGTIWCTGSAVYHPKVKAFFGLPAAEHVAGFIYLGYPAAPPRSASRQPVLYKSQWLGWENLPSQAPTPLTTIREYASGGGHAL
jgi:nitroreductase